MGNIKSVGAAVASILIFVFVVVWSIIAATTIDTAPHLASKTTGAYDSYTRAKDILVLLLPLLTTAAGYWLGSLGTAKAEQVADEAKSETNTVRQQNEALRTASSPEILKQAQELNPTAFGLAKP